MQLANIEKSSFVHTGLDNSSVSAKQKFLDANFKNVLNFMEHFLFDFAMDGKAIPLEEAGRLLQREDVAIPTSSDRNAGDCVSVTLINGIPGLGRVEG